MAQSNTSGDLGDSVGGIIIVLGIIAVVVIIGVIGSSKLKHPTKPEQIGTGEMQEPAEKVVEEPPSLQTIKTQADQEEREMDAVEEETDKLQFMLDGLVE